MRSPSDLRVQPGQIILAAHHNGLVDLAESMSLGSSSIAHQDKDGVIIRASLHGLSPRTNHAFRIALGEDGDDVLLTFTPAHVAGIMPTIDDEGLDHFDEAGNPPALRVGKSAWKKVGAVERTLVMFRYELAGDFTVAKVVPVAVPAPPARKPFTWHKLVAILVKQNGDIRVFPQMFFPQNFLAAETTTSGGFRPLPYAEP